MGNPRGKGVGCDEPRIQGSISIDRDVWKEAARLARTQGVSRSRIIENLLRTAIGAPTVPTLVPIGKPARPVSKRQQKRAARRAMAPAAIAIEKVIEVAPEPEVEEFRPITLDLVEGGRDGAFDVIFPYLDSVPEGGMSIGIKTMVYNDLYPKVKMLEELGHEILWFKGKDGCLLAPIINCDDQLKMLATLPYSAFLGGAELKGFMKRYPGVFSSVTGGKKALAKALAHMPYNLKATDRLVTSELAVLHGIEDDHKNTVDTQWLLQRSDVEGAEIDGSTEHKQWESICHKQILLIEIVRALIIPPYFKDYLHYACTVIEAEQKSNGFGGRS